MNTTIELSFYPLREHYRELIKDFIRKLKEYKGLKITVGATSTVMIGEHTQVINCMKEMMEWSHTNQGRSVFVAKIILDYDPS
ncbi:MAG: thiamine-binding protein [Desulfobacterales bacterium]